MGWSPTSPPWWDRELDERGKPIRSDVRDAAQRLWPRARTTVEKILGDSADAPELLENAVGAISRYLNHQNAEPQDPTGLILVALHRLASRMAGQRGRVQAIGGSSDLAERLRAPDWIDAADRRLFLEELTSCLSQENKGVLNLRMDDFSWEEIAKMRGIAPLTLRSNFWRDVRRAHLKLLRKPNLQDGKR